MEYACIALFILTFLFDLLLLKCEVRRTQKLTQHELKDQFEKSLSQVNSVLVGVEKKIKTDRRLLGNIDYGDVEEATGFLDYSITEIWWPTIPTTKTAKRTHKPLNFTVSPGFWLTRRSTHASSSQGETTSGMENIGSEPPGFEPPNSGPPWPYYQGDNHNLKYEQTRFVSPGSGPQNYVPSGYGQPGFKPYGSGPQDYRPSGYRQSGFRQPGLRPQVYRQWYGSNGSGPKDYGPSGYELPGSRLSRLKPSEFRPPESVPLGYGPQRYKPPDYRQPEFEQQGSIPKDRPPVYGLPGFQHLESGPKKYRPPVYGQPGSGHLESGPKRYRPPVYGPPGFEQPMPGPQDYRPPGYGPPGSRQPGFIPQAYDPSKFGLPYDAPPGFVPMPADSERQGLITTTAVPDTTAETTTETTTTSDVFGRPSFTPFHPMDFVRNLTTSTPASTTTPYSLLIEGMAPLEVSSTHRPFRQELETFMVTHQTGYFSTFATKLFEILSNKPQYEVKTLSEGFLWELEMIIDQKRLLFLGEKLLSSVHTIKNIILAEPADVLKSKAIVLHSLLMNRKVLVSTDVGAVITFIDTFYNEQQGEALFNTLEDVHQYPIPGKPARYVASNLMTTLINPLAQAGHTELGQIRQQKLIHTIEKLIEVHSHDLAGMTVPGRRRGSYFVTLAPKKVLMSINKILNKGYDGNKYNTKQHQYRHSLHKKLKKTHGQYKGQNKGQYKGHKYKHKHHKNDKLGDKEHTASKQEHIYRQKKQTKKKHSGHRGAREGHSYEKMLSKKYEHQINRGNRYFTKHNSNNLNASHQANIQKRFNVVTSQNVESKYTFFKRANDIAHVSSRKGVEIPKSMLFNQTFPNKKGVNRMLEKIIAPSSVSDEEQDLKSNLYDAFYHGNMTLMNARKSARFGPDATSGTDDEALLKNYIYKYFGYDPDIGIKDISSK